MNKEMKKYLRNIKVEKIEHPEGYGGFKCSICKKPAIYSVTTPILKEKEHTPRKHYCKKHEPSNIKILFIKIQQFIRKNLVR